MAVSIAVSTLLAYALLAARLQPANAAFAVVRWLAVVGWLAGRM